MFAALQFPIEEGLAGQAPDNLRKASSTFTQNDATHWQVNYKEKGVASHDVITFSNAATIEATDFLFV